MQRTEYLSAHDHGVRITRLLQGGVVCDGGVGQQALVQSFNAVEHHLREFHTRQFFAVQQACQCVRV